MCGAHWCWSCERNFAVCDAIGGCEDDEGEEDYDPSDLDEDNDTEEVFKRISEPEEEAEDILQDTTALRMDDVESATVGNMDIDQNGQASTATHTMEVDRAVPQRRRSINLDRGSHAFWENEGLDFGNEPDSHENDESWGCSVSLDSIFLVCVPLLIHDTARMGRHEQESRGRPRQEGLLGVLGGDRRG